MLNQIQISELLNPICVQCNNVLKGSQTKFCCESCKNKYYNNNNYDNQQLRGLNRKLALIKLFGGGCQKCDYKKNTAALEFHHRDPSKKRFRLDLRNLSNRSLNSIIDEANKCDLLCANCHAEEHHPGFLLG